MAKTQWHPAFCAAMRLELRGNPSLCFTNEFNLTESPLEVDLLVINNPAGTRIENGIGEFFGGHNLLEYKSPTDHGFNRFAIFQALSYAYYYCNKYQTNDVTLSLVVSRAHFNLIRWMRAEGIPYTKRHEGIYTVQGIGFLRVQVVVTEELDGEEFGWLSVLTDRLQAGAAKEFVTATQGLTGYEEKSLAGAIAQVITGANGRLFEKMKEEGKMASALMELMRPEVEKYAQSYAIDYARKCVEDSVRENNIEHAKAMIRYGADNDYIKLIVDMTDEEINELRKAM